MVGGAGRDGRQSHPRHACFRNHLAGGGAGSSSSGALCSRRTNARTCHHRRDRSRIPLALGVFALGPPRHLAPGVASNTIHAHGELVRLLVATFRRRLWPLEPWRASVHTVAMCHGRCRCGLALALQGGRWLLLRRPQQPCMLLLSIAPLVPPAAPAVAAVGEPAFGPFGEPAILLGMPFFVGLVVD